MVTTTTDPLEPPEDPWAATGYVARRPPELDPAPVAEGVTCPLCLATTGHQINTNAAGGIVCGQCWCVFTSAPGELDRNAGRRRTYLAHPDPQEVTDAAA